MIHREKNMSLAPVSWTHQNFYEFGQLSIERNSSNIDQLKTDIFDKRHIFKLLECPHPIIHSSPSVSMFEAEEKEYIARIVFLLGLEHLRTHGS